MFAGKPGMRVSRFQEMGVVPRAGPALHWRLVDTPLATRDRAIV